MTRLYLCAVYTFPGISIEIQVEHHLFSLNSKNHFSNVQPEFIHSIEPK